MVHISFGGLLLVGTFHPVINELRKNNSFFIATVYTSLLISERSSSKANNTHMVPISF